MQLRTTSDPMCEITACSEAATGLLCLRQVSSVKVRNLDPEWSETFDLPVAAEPDNLEAALEGAAAGLASASVSHIFPPEKMPLWQKEGLVPGLHGTKSPSRWSSWTETNSDTEALEKGLDNWRSRLDFASATVDVTPSCTLQPAEDAGIPGVQRQVTLETAQTIEEDAAQDKKWVVRVFSEEERRLAQSGRILVPQATSDEIRLERYTMQAASGSDSTLGEMGISAILPAVGPTVSETRGLQQPICWSFSSCATCFPDVP